jgi:serine/threonine protein kinase
MGVVYLTRDPLLDRQVAVKVVTPSRLTPESEERFRREARLVAKMDHPAIVPVHDVGEEDQSLFLVMPFVEGTNLRTLMDQNSLKLGDLIEIGIQTAAGVRVLSYGIENDNADFFGNQSIVAQPEMDRIRSRCFENVVSHVIQVNRISFCHFAVRMFA